MEWISALFKVLWEQVYFVILIPVVLIIGTIIIMPFEWAGEKFMNQFGDYKGNKFIEYSLIAIAVMIGLAPAVLVYFYAVYFE